MNDEYIGGVPLLWGFTTFNPMEVAVHCRWCLAWHHHGLTALHNAIDYYQAHCYARPEWYDRGYWIRPTETSMDRVYKQSRLARPYEVRLLLAGKTSPTIQRKQAARSPRPLPPVVDWAEYRREKLPPSAPPQWPTSYPTFPDDEDD
ncbi:hypothetical protein [Streptomyces sp. GbtcB6]|uniref:hypothetical protein n=1 Tax=Streptomyces sp. GbtcB6 TaxID=2824751 RepID=UPI001C304564|nr:hypothetical protein [Streptomyces sp. GbtcB6]